MKSKLRKVLIFALLTNVAAMGAPAFAQTAPANQGNRGAASDAANLPADGGGGRRGGRGGGGAPSAPLPPYGSPEHQLAVGAAAASGATPAQEYYPWLATQ